MHSCLFCGIIFCTIVQPERLSSAKIQCEREIYNVEQQQLVRAFSNGLAKYLHSRDGHTVVVRQSARCAFLGRALLIDTFILAQTTRQQILHICIGIGVCDLSIRLN